MAAPRKIVNEPKCMSEQILRARCAERGLAIARFGKAWRVYGDDVSLVVASLHGVLSLEDLKPVRGTET